MFKLPNVRLIKGRLRSAGIVAAATLVLGASSALAANQVKPSPSGDPHARPSASESAKPSDKASAKPSEAPEAKPSASDSSAPKPGAPKAAGPGDAHGDCVSKVAEDPNAKAPNKHGKMTHGAAVSKAAHECAKGHDEGDTKDQAEPPDKPEPAESEAPEAPESPEAGEAPKAPKAPKGAGPRG